MSCCSFLSLDSLSPSRVTFFIGIKITGSIKKKEETLTIFPRFACKNALVSKRCLCMCYSRKDYFCLGETAEVRYLSRMKRLVGCRVSRLLYELIIFTCFWNDISENKNVNLDKKLQWLFLTHDRLKLHREFGADELYVQSLCYIWTIL